MQGKEGVMWAGGLVGVVCVAASCAGYLPADPCLCQPPFPVKCAFNGVGPAVGLVGVAAASRRVVL